MEITASVPKHGVRHVMWTGGMDSTLVILRYAMVEGISVLPVYICNANKRKTEAVELNHMHQIYEIVRNDPRTRAELLPIRIVADSPEDIPELEFEDYEFYRRKRYKESGALVKEAQRLVLDYQKNTAPGVMPQRSNIIRVADQYKPVLSYIRAEKVSVALGFNSEDSIFGLPELCAAKAFTDEAGFTSYVLDPERTHPAIYAVFKDITFPIYDVNKVGVYNAFEEMGFTNIRRMVWHCYRPIDGKACGQCVTCVPYIREGMTDMFDRDAFIRYIRFAEKERAVINEQYQEIIRRNVEETRNSVKKQILQVLGADDLNK